MEYSLDGVVTTSVPERNYNLKWSVEKISKLPYDVEIKSPLFLVEEKDIKWRASFTINNDSSVELKLYRNSSHDALLIFCDAKVLDCNGKAYYENSRKEYCSGLPLNSKEKPVKTIISFPTIKSTIVKELKTVPNDTWVFIFLIKTCQIITTIENIPLRPNYEEMAKKSLFENSFKMFQNKIGTDVTLLVGDGKLEVHKMVLCAQSAVFAKMFEVPMSENDKNTVVIDEVSEVAIKELINYMYCKVNTNYTFETALEVYYVADKYEVVGLRELCRGILISCINLENAGMLFEMADKHGDELLIRKVKKYVTSNIKSCYKTNWWSEFMSAKTQLFDKLTG